MPQRTGDIMKRSRRTFSAQFKLECAQLVVDQGYTVKEAAQAMSVGVPALTNWVSQLKQERSGASPKGSALTPEQIEIQQLKRRIKYLEEEKDILKKATALLMSDTLNNVR
jgi:transposase